KQCPVIRATHFGLEFRLHRLSFFELLTPFMTSTILKVLKHRKIAMTIREGEVQSRRRRLHESTSLTSLAIEVVRDDPETSDAKLVRRWVVRVQDDDDLLEACLLSQVKGRR